MRMLICSDGRPHGRLLAGLFGSPPGIWMSRNPCPQKKFGVEAVEQINIENIHCCCLGEKQRLCRLGKSNVRAGGSTTKSLWRHDFGGRSNYPSGNYMIF